MLLVISDLHMGAGALDDFESEIEGHFVDFLRHFGSQSGPVELVINGDLLDFVQAPPFTGKELEGDTAAGIPLCFTQAQSREKLAAIARQHAASLQALGEFLCDEEKSITILPGNHDADFFWPDVRTDFLACLQAAGNGASRVRFHLDRIYRPKADPRVWIEHGHQFDRVNSFFNGEYACWHEENPPIFVARDASRRLYECVGTRFLIRYLNTLDAEYPFVDNVKPFWRFVQLFGASAFQAGFGPLKAVVAVSAMLRYLARTGIANPSEFLEAVPKGEGASEQSAAAVLLEAVRRASREDRRNFTEALERAGFAVQSSLEMLLSDAEAANQLAEFLADHLEVADALGDVEDQGVLELGKGFTVNETDELRKGAAAILKEPANGCDVVIMGHTHERVDEAGYLNTGSWTRYYEVPASGKLEPWSVLRSRSYERFPYRLDYASVASPGGRAELKTFASTIEGAA